MRLTGLYRASPDVLKDTVMYGRWDVSDSTLLSVHQNGRIIAKGVGTATVRLTIDGSSDTTAVRVVHPGWRASTRWADVFVGFETTCAIAVDGKAYCWGRDQFGNLGNGTHQRWTAFVAPEPVESALQWSKVEVGVDHACGLTTQGDAYCWGSRVALFEPREEYSSEILVPRHIPTPESLQDLSVGGRPNCGLGGTGEAYCWGFNSTGEIGDGTAGLDDFRRSPVAVHTDTAFGSLALGFFHSCALTEDGQPYCWGYGGGGSLGTGERQDRSVPTQVAVNDPLTGLSGISSMCGINPSQLLTCWGPNHANQLLDAPQLAFSPVTIDPGFDVSQVAPGVRATCAISTGGGTYCWGKDEQGLLGSGGTASSPCNDGSQICATDPVEVAGGHRFREISMGWRTACGITIEDQIFCWGSNMFGQLGNGSTVAYSDEPVPVVDPFN